MILICGSKVAILEKEKSPGQRRVGVISTVYPSHYSRGLNGPTVSQGNPPNIQKRQFRINTPLNQQAMNGNRATNNGNNKRAQRDLPKSNQDLNMNRKLKSGSPSQLKQIQTYNKKGMQVVRDLTLENV